MQLHSLMVEDTSTHGQVRSTQSRILSPPRPLAAPPARPQTAPTLCPTGLTRCAWFVLCLWCSEMPLTCGVRLWDTYIAEQAEGFSSFHVYVCAGRALGGAVAWRGLEGCFDVDKHSCAFLTSFARLRVNKTRSLQCFR